VGLAITAGAKQQQVFRLQQPGGLPRQALELLPVAELEMLVIKTVEALLPGEMGAAQQALLARDLPLLQLLFTEGVEELARAPARRTDRCALPIQPQPVRPAAASGCESAPA
jgi:hypothetical protein